MLVRDPLIYATTYYLRDEPGDGAARRDERHAAFEADLRQTVHDLSGWLAMDPPDLPPVPRWTLDPPDGVQPLVKTSQLHGRTNASAWVGGYVLRNMLLLRVVLLRSGEHDTDAWDLLREAMGDPPATPSRLDTQLYWCGLAPRVPENLEAGRGLPMQTPFGVLSVAQSAPAHVLVYPDARTEARANAFLRALAPRLDWYPVQARHAMTAYESHASRTVKAQQRALDQVTQAVQAWRVPHDRRGLRALAPLDVELTVLETTYAGLLDDLTTTQAAARRMADLAAGYRQELMRSGLWDAAPSQWAAQAERVAALHGQIDGDVRHIDATLRRVESMMRGMELRLGVLQHERERLLVLLVAALGMALLVVLLADTSPARILVRLAALALVGVLVWGGWRWWARSRTD